MSSKLPQNLLFQRPEHRGEFERARAQVKGTIGNTPFNAAADALVDLAGAFDGAVARLKRDLLGSSLCWNEDNQSLTSWIHKQHRGMADMAQRLIDEDRAGEAPALPVMALLLHQEGEAMKWIAGRERPDMAQLNGLLAQAFDDGLASQAFSWTVEARGYTVSLESLYLRLLLLDRLGTGVLTRQQIEVLDAWLLDWAPVLRLQEAKPEGAALQIDIGSEAGLRSELAGEAAGRVLYLALAPLEARRRAVVRELQLGNLVPAFGCAAEFRIEEHVAVLRHLERTLRGPLDAGARRDAREAAPGTRIETWVGVAEIVANAAGSRSPVETGQWRPLASQPDAAANDRVDPNKRYLWLCDTSTTGCGFEALEQDAAGLEIGDLIGWRRGSGVALGRIIRRLPGSTAGQVFLGVRLLSDRGFVFTMKRVDSLDRDDAPAALLYVPGDDQCGRHDAFLVPETTFSQQHAYRARVGDETFTLRFNRVRERGRGWILGGFEIVPPRPEVPQFVEGNLPVAELAPVAGQEEAYDPWEREVPLRLLD